jgi:hypothetical protein
MKPIARITLAAIALALVASLLSGCIINIEDIGCGDRVRRATLYVYVRDYYSGAPIRCARVELYERGWWSWDYIDSWGVNDYGYAAVRGGYLSYDTCGGYEEERYLVVVSAPGYCTTEYEIELSYYYPSETLTFYLVPWYGREGGKVPASGGNEAGRVDVGTESDAAN